MVCENCGKEIPIGYAFCTHCGAKNEKPEICLKCGSRLAEGAKFCTVCGAEVNPMSVYQQPEVKKKASGNSKGKVVLIIAIVIFVFAVSIVGGFMVLNSSNNAKKKDSSNNQKFLTDVSSTEDENTEDEEAEAEEETEEETEEKTEEEENENVYEEENDDTEYEEVVGIEGFSYRLNLTDIELSPSYYITDNQYYAYYCAIPTHFKEYGDGESFYSPDMSALMSVSADINTNNLSVDAVMEAFIRKTGGTVKYQATGEAWFAVAIERNGINYYQKCYVDHMIRAFSFSYPKEYQYVYDGYVNYIEDNFKRTDV